MLNDLLNHATRGIKPIVSGIEYNVPFSYIVPETDCVIELIEHQEALNFGAMVWDTTDGNPASPSEWTGKTLKAGLPYPLYGSKIELTSGTAFIARI